MHTFFLNTSGQQIDNVSDLLEIELENKKLVILDCPFDTWDSREDGFRSCAVRMGNLIDDYEELSGEYQLVIYVDLISDQTYSAIPQVGTRGQEICSCLEALHAYYEDLICDTLLNELEDAGRLPLRTVILFEENLNPNRQVDRNDAVKNGIREYCRGFLGLPSEEALNGLFAERPALADEAGTEEFLGALRPLCTPGLDGQPLERYGEELDTFLKERRAGNPEAYRQLLEKVGSHSKRHSFVRVLFLTNRRGRSANKMERARRGVRLCCYLIRVTGGEGAEERLVPELDWNEVLLRLKKAKLKFGEQHRYTENLSANYTELEMAPTLYRYNREMFGLDESGHVSRELTVREVEKVRGETKKKGGETDEEPMIRADKMTVVEKENAPTRMLPGYRAVDPETGLKKEAAKKAKGRERGKDDGEKERTPKGRELAAAYEKRALALREDHTEYLKRVAAHVLDTMSDYAGKSAENSPAILRKRSVGIAEEDFRGPETDYRYAVPVKEPETDKFTKVKDFSENAYETVLQKYLEFCVGRALAVTDIKELCDAFLTKLYGIAKSLEKAKTVLLGLLAALFLLLIPFPLIQWPAITQNVVTVAVALGSFLAPFALLLAAFGIAVSAQKKKMRKEWQKFRAQADDVMRDNRTAVEQYDQLLAEYIPALRWTYEYRLDVAFYEDCCKLARAKIAHHMEKTHGRTVAVANLIQDLEYDGALEVRSEAPARAAAQKTDPAEAVDYALPFCKGEKNRAFYSVFSVNDVDEMIAKEGEGER